MTEVKPVRLQLSRRNGFDLQAWSREVNGLPAVKANRSTKLGNPFAVTKATTARNGKTEDAWVVGSWNGPAMWIRPTREEALDISIRAYQAWIAKPENAGALAIARGKNIACWCDLGNLCHVNVIIELANIDAPEAREA